MDTNIYDAVNGINELQQSIRGLATLTITDDTATLREQHHQHDVLMTEETTVGNVPQASTDLKEPETEVTQPVEQVRIIAFLNDFFKWADSHRTDCDELIEHINWYDEWCRKWPVHEQESRRLRAKSDISAGVVALRKHWEYWPTRVEGLFIKLQRFRNTDIALLEQWRLKQEVMEKAIQMTEQYAAAF